MASLTDSAGFHHGIFSDYSRSSLICPGRSLSANMRLHSAKLKQIPATDYIIIKCIFHFYNWIYPGTQAVPNLHDIYTAFWYNITIIIVRLVLPWDPHYHMFIIIFFSTARNRIICFSSAAIESFHFCGLQRLVIAETRRYWEGFHVNQLVSKSMNHCRSVLLRSTVWV